MRKLALLWLLVVAIAGGYFLVRVHDGLTFQTDLMALLPKEQQDPVLQRADDAVTKALSQKIILLVGSADPVAARNAAAAMNTRLAASGLVDLTTDGLGKDRIQALGKLYFPYRTGLLSRNDRALLLQDKGDVIATRALSQAYGFMGLSDPRLLQNDPFLLLPNFFTGLPLPLSHLTPDEGVLSVQDDGTYWVFIAASLRGDPFALDTQKGMTDLYNNMMAEHPNVKTLHLGAVFFAHAGAKQALDESSSISFFSIVGVILLMLAVFRAWSPLLSSLLTVAVGVLTAMSACLWIFGQLHVGALLFGVSLIGVAVDYAMQYNAEIFTNPPGTPRERLRRIIGGISVGTVTTMIGYLTLLLAPFPGLRQAAVFSSLGLFGACVTVALWLPALDRMKQTRHGVNMLRFTSRFVNFWQSPPLRRRRIIMASLFVVVAAIGLTRFHIDDDVRNLQSLSSDLMTEQKQIQTLIGSSDNNQFFLIQAKNEEEGLKAQEALADRLTPLVGTGKLAGFQGLADYIPSINRQTENRTLVTALHTKHGREHASKLGMNTAFKPLDAKAPYVTPTLLKKTNALPAFLSFFSLPTIDDETLLIVTLSGVQDQAAVSDAANGMTGVRFIDPTGDYSRLMGKYRERALCLLLLSTILMTPLLMWRYGPRGCAKIIAVPILAIALTPGLRALTGASFTFFDAMGLVLILAIGIDYAVFSAETSGARKPVTMLAVTLAACTALLSFGLLAFSGVSAVSHFGATMLTGISLSFLLAPLASTSDKTT